MVMAGFRVSLLGILVTFVAEIWLVKGSSLSVLLTDVGDTFETATSIPLGDYVVHTLETDSDVDFFKINMIEGQVHTLTLFRTFYVFDTRIEEDFVTSVLDQNNSVVSVSSSTPEGTVGQFSFTPSYTGPHIFRIASDDDVGEYTFGAVLGSTAVLPTVNLPLVPTEPFPVTEFPGSLTVNSPGVLRFSYNSNITATLYIALFTSVDDYAVYKSNGELVTENSRFTRGILSFPVAEGEEVFITLTRPFSELTLLVTTDQFPEGDKEETDTGLVAAISVLSCLLAISTIGNLSLYRIT